MIQRVQTIFLFLAAGVFGAFFGLPFASSDVAAPTFFSDKVFNVMDHAALIGLAGLGILLALITIFLFKNRKLQIKFGYMIIGLAIILPAVAYFLFKNESVSKNSAIHLSIQPGVFLPIVAIIFVLLKLIYFLFDNFLIFDLMDFVDL
jgi:hypothetical protein